MEASREAYYLWATRCPAELPWHRTYLNIDYIESESRRLREVGEWFSSFTKIPEGQPVDPVTLYVVDIDLPQVWAVVFQHFPDHTPVGLSALPNSANNCLIGLFPTRQTPPLYLPVRVDQGRKFIAQTPEAVPRLEYVLLVESAQSERHASLYLEFPKSYARPSDFLAETLTGGDCSLASSVEAPLVSSPPTTRAGGGVSLSAFEPQSRFSRAFQRSTQALLPPHLRSISAPRRAREGNRVPSSSGITYRVAERWGRQPSRVQSVLAREFSMIPAAYSERANATGELSFISTLTTPAAQEAEVWDVLLREFAVSELTLPSPLIELLEGVDLERFERSIPEEMFFHVAESREVQPRSSGGFRRASEEVYTGIRADVDALLADRRVGYAGEVEVDRLSAEISSNVYRIAQAEARAARKNVVGDVEVRQARGLVLDSLGKLLNRPDVRGLHVAAKRASKDRRERAVQLSLTYNGPSSIMELWETIRSEDLFDSAEDLARYLDLLRDRGRVILHPRRGFTWVGRIG